VDKRINGEETNDNNKKEDITWRLAVRLLEKHLTRANRAQRND